MTRRYDIAPGVVRLRAGEQRPRSGKRVSHWLTAVLPKPVRKPKTPQVAQQALF